MVNKNNNTGAYVLIGILCTLVLLLGGYIVYDKVLSNKILSVENNNTDVKDNASDAADDNVQQSQSNSITEDDYIRQTSLVLVEEPNCNGNNPAASLVAEINSEKNIAISQNKVAEEIIVGNAKYLYKVNVLVCDAVKLYYITEDNELYVVDHPNTGNPNQKGIKVSSTKIIEFLGQEVRDDGAYIKVLTEDKNIEYIKFFTTPGYSS